MRTCSVDGCGKKHYARTWCGMHYNRWFHNGSPDVRHLLRGAPPVERFLSKVNKTDTCWLWTGKLSHNGYPAMWLDGREVRAYRWAYEHFVGPIPEGLQIDHLCRVPACVRPDHLEPVTPRENLLRGDTFQARNAAKTHCVNGHKFTPENTYAQPKGGRQCRACRAENTRASRAKEAALRPPRSPLSGCLHGHEFTPENTYVNPKGVKVCRTCKRERGRRATSGRQRTA